jgi:hypothetical protein
VSFQITSTNCIYMFTWGQDYQVTFTQMEGRRAYGYSANYIVGAPHLMQARPRGGQEVGARRSLLALLASMTCHFTLRKQDMVTVCD